MTRLTPSIKKKITADWNSLLPGLGVYKPMWLLRRCGPLLTGVCLDRDGSGDQYIPRAHVHCLANEWDGLYLGLCQSLTRLRTGSENWIRVRWHENHWRDAATRMAQQSLLPLSGPISPEQVATAFRRYKEEFPDGDHSTNLYRDWLLTLAWTGRRHEVQLLLAEAEQDIKKWPPYIIERDGGLGAWLREMERLTSNPEKLRHTVEEQLLRNKAEKLPAVDVSSWLV
jgi:hypothetical protein